ncbi:WD40 repeat-like protein [Rhizopus microsporus var. microsporus]|nr:WD40 repeat-like protein [Rhizopus microsporus var. microsporus]
MENSNVFGLRHQARCLTSVKKSTEKSKFLAGTVGAKENVVCLLEYDDDNALLSSFMFQHPQEVWDIASCPNDEDVFFTCHSSVCESPLKSKATLWRKPSVSIENQQQELIPLMTLDYEGAKKVVWSNEEGDQQAACIDSTQIHLFSTENAKTLRTIDASSMFSAGSDAPSLKLLQNAVWNPHDPQIIAVGGNCVAGWDIRSGQNSFKILNAHQSTVRAVDYNPNKRHHLATGSDDALVHLWDVRQLEKPLMTLEGNSHWIWSVAFNPLQDQLLLASGSDGLVHLHNVYSISSAATMEEEEEEIGQKPSDGLICTYDQHEDSIYSAVWSFADTWTFASISYAGRVVISQVPSEEKFKILGV